MRSKTQTNRDLHARFFPRFTPVSLACNCFVFWLAHWNVSVCRDWLSVCQYWLLWFLFYGAQLKTAPWQQGFLKDVLFSDYYTAGACRRYSALFDWPSDRALFSRNVHGTITNYANRKQKVTQRPSFCCIDRANAARPQFEVSPSMKTSLSVNK